jgi:hypothetical protein
VSALGTLLYRAFSVIENFRGLPVAHVHWVPLRAERLRFGPLDELVADYRELSAEELSITRGYLDEFLTPVEANQLRRALQAGFGYTAELIGTPVPIPCRNGSGEVIYPFRALPESTWKGQEILAHRGKLELPFDILALWKGNHTEGGF